VCVFVRVCACLYLLQARGVVLSQLVHLSLPDALLLLEHLNDGRLALVQVTADVLHLLMSNTVLRIYGGDGRTGSWAGGVTSDPGLKDGSVSDPQCPHKLPCYQATNDNGF